MTASERAAAPDPVPMDVIAAAVVALIRDDSAAGRVVELREGALTTTSRPRAAR